MRTFIVNLKHSLERRAKMECQLSELNIAYEFIEAVDGRKMTETELKMSHGRQIMLFFREKWVVH